MRCTIHTFRRPRHSSFTRRRAGAGRALRHRLAWRQPARDGPAQRRTGRRGAVGFPEAGGGYREVIEHDLETPLSLNRQYDAAVCCEAIHLVTNPGVLVESLRRALRPGGTVVITTPNTWYFRSRLQFLLRGFHSGFRPMVGRQRERDYITYFPGAIRSCICCCRTTATWTSRCTRSTRSSQADAGASAGAAVAPVLPAADQARRKRGSAAVLARSRARPVGAWPLAGGVGATAGRDMAA